MLAMLLHDVGKGGDRGQLEDGAIAARRACDRLGIDPRRTEFVVWLVLNHLALSDYARSGTSRTRRRCGPSPIWSAIRSGCGPCWS